ncbi:hypothetical protein L9F63_019803 [Diploptera punctata]|uniref:Uncharacterized protein n=1 Tax=Diploptera punctata TaxID=6984 RepID=A0AAD7ZTH1_DIPPU|nr:hypothetical protein L9F63_019803 [Diploptera punctata]
MLRPIADGCPSLKHIFLGYCEFSDDDIQYFLNRKKCQLLSFSSKSIYISIFKHLSECIKLEYIYLENDNKNLTYNDTVPLTKLRHLKSLTLQYCTENAENLPKFFLHGSFSKIVELDLSHNFSIQDSDFNIVLKNFPNIKHLNLSSSHMLSDEGLYNISHCGYLEHLNISMCNKMTDKSTYYVSKGCAKLKHLNISSCNNMTDEAILHLLMCKNLQVLKLGFKKLTGIYFNLFSKKLVQLKEIYIDFSDSLDKTVIDHLQQKMPQLNIIYPFYYGHGDTEFKETYFAAMN